MAVSSGFFNSQNHDRLYNAQQLSSIFDGIILDGVYENYGEAFNVTPYTESPNTVIVGTGRAWFDHTWTLNDSQFAVTIDPPNDMLNRVDAIVLDIDNRLEVRKNSILYLRGDELDPENPPSLIKEDFHNQYPICYITCPAGSDGYVKQKDITITVGMDECPIVTGILESQNLQNLFQQLGDEFNLWWDGIKDTLDENTVTNLLNRIIALEELVTGDNAQVGLLDKSVADLFVTGDYGLNISTYTLPSGSQILNTLNTDGNVEYIQPRETCFDNSFAFLPDKTVVRFIHSNDNKSYGSHVDDLILCRYTTSGVASYDVIYTPVAERNDGFNITYADYSSGYSLVNHYLDLFPVRFYFISGRCDGFSSPGPMNFSVIEVSISSSGVISKREVSAETVGTFGSVDGINLPKTIPVFSDGSGIAPIGLYNTVQLGKARMSDYVTVKVTKQGVTSNVITQPPTGHGKDLPGFGELGELGYRTYVKDGKVVFYPYCDENNKPSGNKTDLWVSVDPESLSCEKMTTTVNLPDTGEYFTNYSASSYSLSASSGVSVLKNERFGSSDGETSYDRPYYIGASNLGGAIPQGEYFAGEDEKGNLCGLGPNGEQILIGTNGGAAILADKKSLSTTLDFGKIVKNLKGYVSDNSGLYVIMANSRIFTDPDNLSTDNMTVDKGTVVIMSRSSD